MPIRDVILPLASSRTLGQVILLALAMGVYSCLPVWLGLNQWLGNNAISSQFHAALSLVLGCLLVFRTNTAYARWWEARTLWGNLVNASRNLAIKLLSLVHLSPADRNQLQRSLEIYPVLLATHLRRVTLESEIEYETYRPCHEPAQLVQDMYAWLGNAKEQGQLDGDVLRVIDIELTRYLDVCGACERIRRTPFVRSYRTFTRQCIAMILFTLPWSLAHHCGWWTIPLTVITSYFMLGLEIVAEHVEEPFGLDEDDLDLGAMCTTIRQSMREIFASSEGVSIKEHPGTSSNV